MPVDLDGHLFSDDYDSPWKSEILSRGVCDLTKTKGTAFKNALEKLVRALRADAGRKLPPPEPKL